MEKIMTSLEREGKEKYLMGLVEEEGFDSIRSISYSNYIKNGFAYVNPNSPSCVVVSTQIEEYGFSEAELKALFSHENKHCFDLTRNNMYLDGKLFFFNFMGDEVKVELLEIRANLELIDHLKEKEEFGFFAYPKASNLCIRRSVDSTISSYFTLRCATKFKDNYRTLESFLRKDGLNRHERSAIENHLDYCDRSFGLI